MVFINLDGSEEAGETVQGTALTTTNVLASLKELVLLAQEQ